MTEDQVVKEVDLVLEKCGMKLSAGQRIRIAWEVKRDYERFTTAGYRMKLSLIKTTNPWSLEYQCIYQVETAVFTIPAG
jgi:hypothetical protein